MSFIDRFKYKFLERNFPVEILDTMMNSNANTTEILVRLLFPDIAYQRVNEPLLEQGFATHFLEFDQRKLNLMLNHGRNSFSQKEREIETLLA